MVDWGGNILVDIFQKLQQLIYPARAGIFRLNITSLG